MIGGLKKTTSRFALAAAAGMVAGGLALSPASAADLGGDCCADLEERVAELEATTVRKGTRVMSLKLSGQINTMLVYWDDGDESNVYVVDNENSNTRFMMSGKANFAPGWYSRFELVVRAAGATSSAGFSQITDGGGDRALAVRESWWAIGNDSLGEIQVGRLEPATDNLILIDLGSGIGGSNDVGLIGRGLFVRQSGLPGSGGLVTGVTMGAFWQANILDTPRRNGIMYVSPTFFGFQLLWSWGEDDTWDVAVRWKQEWNGVRMAAGIGYLEDYDEPDGIVFQPGDRDRSEFKGSASVLHTPTGLYAAFAWVHREFSGSADGWNAASVCTNQAGTQVSCPDFDYYYVAAGIAKNWFGIGTTSFYGEWAQGEDALVGQTIAFTPAGGGGTQLTGIVTTSDVEMYGIGVGQKISQGSLELYLNWRHFDYDLKGVQGANIVTVPLEDLDIVYAGARLKF